MPKFRVTFEHLNVQVLENGKELGITTAIMLCITTGGLGRVSIVGYSLGSSWGLYERVTVTPATDS